MINLDAWKDGAWVCEVCRLRRAEDMFEDLLVCAPCRVVMGRLVARREDAVRAVPPARSRLEVQWAHDVLQLALGDPAVVQAIDLDPDLVRALAVAANCLCWVLGHEDTAASRMAGVLEGVEWRMRAAGFPIGRSGWPVDAALTEEAEG